MAAGAAGGRLHRVPLVGSCDHGAGQRRLPAVQRTPDRRLPSLPQGGRDPIGHDRRGAESAASDRGVGVRLPGLERSPRLSVAILRAGAGRRSDAVSPYRRPARLHPHRVHFHLAVVPDDRGHRALAPPPDVAMDGARGAGLRPCDYGPASRGQSAGGVAVPVLARLETLRRAAARAGCGSRRAHRPLPVGRERNLARIPRFRIAPQSRRQAPVRQGADNRTWADAVRPGTRRNRGHGTGGHGACAGADRRRAKPQRACKASSGVRGNWPTRDVLACVFAESKGGSRSAGT